MDKNTFTKENGVVRWQSPSNIALVKYWGKYGNQLPKNPSLSLTLKHSYSDTRIVYQYNSKQTGISFSFKFESRVNRKFTEKIKKYLKNIKSNFSFLNNYHLDIESQNTFPHSAGIASSAAFYSSLALCLGTIEKRLSKSDETQNLTSVQKKNKEFYQKASNMARLGSGSASRSVYGGLALWGKIKGIKNSSNNHAIPIKGKNIIKYNNYRDTILIVSSKEKKISSTVGHSLMENNPYASTRFKDAKENMTKLLRAIKNNKQNNFINIIEREALSLHAMMLTSYPSFMFFLPNTISIINEVRDFREKKIINICFTLDAGPNVHLLYPNKDKAMVMKFIKRNLLTYCEDGKYIDDEVGLGPKEIKELI